MVFEESLLNLLEDRGTTSFASNVYRAAMSGQPPLRPNVRGARWNPPDVAALYTSLKQATAQAEWEYVRASQPLRPRGELVIFRVEVISILSWTCPMPRVSSETSGSRWTRCRTMSSGTAPHKTSAARRPFLAEARFSFHLSDRQAAQT